MPAYTMKNLPEDLVYCLQDIIDQDKAEISASDAETRAEILAKFQREIVRRQPSSQLTPRERTDLLRDWLLNEVNLEQPWNGIKQIRVFTHTVRKTRQLYGDYRSVLVFKGTDDQLKIYCLDHPEANQLNQRLAPHLHRRRLGVIQQHEIEKTKWDNLSIYSPDVINFYRNQNQGTLYTLFQMLDKKTHTKPYLIVDLGAGKGELGEDFMRYLSLKGRDWADTHWINVDLSPVNMAISEENKTNDRTHCMTVNVRNFVQNPLKYFEENNLDPAIWMNSEIYIIASGFLTEGVIPFADSIHILRAIRQLENVRGILLTGLHASHISPYLAKQMGFERKNVNVDRLVKDALEIYQPLSFHQQLERLIEKMKKHGILDLSYVSNLTEILKALELIDLSNLKHAFLAGVKVDQSHVALFDQLLEKYPSLLFWSASITPLEKAKFEQMTVFTKAPHRFISLGYLVASPLFSPFFFDNVSQLSETLITAPIAHFMRGVITNVVTCEPIPFHQRMLTARLFLELNEDETEDPIRTLATQLLRHETLDYDKRIRIEELLEQVESSQISVALKEALSDFIRIVPLDCYDVSKKELYSLQDGSKASKECALILHNEGDGVIAPEDWKEIKHRFSLS